MSSKMDSNDQKRRVQTRKVPTTIAGRELVRMQPAALSNMFGGDASMGKKLHESIRAEIQKCSVKTGSGNGN